LIYLDVDEVDQRRRVGDRVGTETGSTFAITPEELDRYRTQFQIPDRDELSDNTLDAPPGGHETWGSWAAQRWPTSLP
jgi:hypothetical protein